LTHQNAYAPHPFALLRPRRRRAAEQGYELASFPLTECIRSLSGQDCKHDIQSVKVSQEASERIYNRPATQRSGPGHSLQVRPRPLSTNVRFPSNSDRKFSAWGFVAMCHLRPKFDRKFEPNNGRRDLFKFHLRFDRD
jgi:hypothetical protein